MTALARDRNPGAMGIDHGRDAEACAGTEHDLGAERVCSSRSDLLDCITFEARKGQGLGLEVVENDHLIEVELFDELQRFDDPVGVCQGDAFSRDRSGRGNDRRAWQEGAVVKKARLGRFGEPRMGIGRDARDRLGRTVGIAHHRKTCVGAANIGDKHGKTEMAWRTLWMMCF